MDGFQAEALRRLPLAQAVFHLFSHVLDQRHLGDLFERHRGRCYQQELSFAAVVCLLRDALLVHEGSGNASFTAAKEAGALPVTVKSVYEKLGRLPLELSLALLRETTTKLLAALHVRAGVALAIEADPDGERNDVPLVPGLVRQVRELIDQPISWTRPLTRQKTCWGPACCDGKSSACSRRSPRSLSCKS
jgi:hypothetical protein